MTNKNERPQDFLMWVGSLDYPTVDVFIQEAEERGPCKRLGKLPGSLELNRSRVFLAHDDGITGEGFIFGYFIPNRLEYIVMKEEDLPDHLWERVTMVEYKEIAHEVERECGDRYLGLYLVATIEEGESSFVAFDQPRILEKFDPGRSHFRGMLRIDYGEKVVNARAKKWFMTPPSREAAPPIAPGTPWTDEEDALVNTLEDAENKNRTAQILSYQTGRSKTAILFRFNQLNKKESE